MLVQRIYADMRSGKTTTALALMHGYHAVGMRALYIGHRPEAIEHMARMSGLPKDRFTVWSTRLLSDDHILRHDAFILDEVNLFREAHEGDPVSLLKQRFSDVKRPMQIIGFYTD